MFDDLKKINEIRKLKNELAKEKIEIEKQGVKIILNGEMKVEKVLIDPGLGKEKLEKNLKDAFNEGVSKLQAVMAGKFSNFSGFGF